MPFALTAAFNPSAAIAYSTCTCTRMPSCVADPSFGNRRRLDLDRSTMLARGSRCEPSGPDVCEEHDHGARLCPISVAGNRRGGLPLDDVVRRVERSVDPAAPWVSCGIARRRQLEVQPFA